MNFLRQHPIRAFVVVFLITEFLILVNHALLSGNYVYLSTLWFWPFRTAIYISDAFITHRFTDPAFTAAIMTILLVVGAYTFWYKLIWSRRTINAPASQTQVVRESSFWLSALSRYLLVPVLVTAIVAALEWIIFQQYEYDPHDAGGAGLGMAIIFFGSIFIAFLLNLALAPLTKSRLFLKRSLITQASIILVVAIMLFISVKS